MTGSTRPSRPYLIGVAGGSGSGKTTFARALLAKLGSELCQIVFQDNFYIDQSHRFDHDGGSVNFDHPDSIDFPLLAERLRELKVGKAVEIPIYDFASHTRSPKTEQVRPSAVIVVDGILIFHSPELRALLDEMVYFNTPESLRFQRRLERDVRERGRTPEGVKQQFMLHVKPMHDQFVEPSKEYATTIIQDGQSFDPILGRIATRFLVATGS